MSVISEKKRIDEIIVYTDGSLIRKKDNGNYILQSGYGIYFPNNEIENISRPFKDGIPTNNRAELKAIYVGLIKIIKKFKFKKIILYSDSEYCIKSLTEYANKWELNDWKTAKNQPVENQDIIKPLYNIVKKIRDKLVFIHVMAHTKNQDDISLNNKTVDELAKKGAEKSEPYIVKI
jgi:ribonuclease HI